MPRIRRGAHTPTTSVGGLVHCLLPLSKSSPEKASTKPAMFTDTGVMAVLEAVFKLGANKKRLVVKAAGGSSPLDKCDRFKIGERNYTVLRKVLWKNDLMLAAKDVGGTKPRTMSLYIATGQTTIKSAGEETEL